MATYIASASSSGSVADGSITTAKLADGAVTNAKVDAAAAIAGTKISPNFGTQNVITTGFLNNMKDLLVTTTEVTISNTVTETSVLSLTVPGGNLDADNLIRIDIDLDILNNTGGSTTLNARLKYGATTLLTLASGNLAANANKRQAKLLGFLKGNGGTSAQKGGLELISPTAVVAGFTGVGTSAEDATTDKTLTITLELSTASTNYAVIMAAARVTLFSI